MKSNNVEVSLQGVTVKQLPISNFEVGVTLGTGRIYFYNQYRFVRKS